MTPSDLLPLGLLWSRPNGGAGGTTRMSRSRDIFNSMFPGECGPKETEPPSGATRSAGLHPPSRGKQSPGQLCASWQQFRGRHIIIPSHPPHNATSHGRGDLDTPTLWSQPALGEALGQSIPEDLVEVVRALGSHEIQALLFALGLGVEAGKVALGGGDGVGHVFSSL